MSRYTDLDPVVVRLEGRLVTDLDDEGLLFVLGHEFGHHLAHGSASPFEWASRLALHRDKRGYGPDRREIRELLHALRQAEELTADRFGLLVCQNLSGALRELMTGVAGVPVAKLDWDASGCMDQCKATVEELLSRCAVAA